VVVRVFGAGLVVFSLVGPMWTLAGLVIDYEFALKKGKNRKNRYAAFNLNHPFKYIPLNKIYINQYF